MRLKPFRALRPPAAIASKVGSPPYDVVTSDEARAMTEGNPLSFLHIIKPEIDLPAETDIYSDAVYDQAKAAFDQFQADGTLVRDDAANLFAYRQEVAGHVQTGIVGTCHIDEYRDGTIKKHENTLKKKEDDRTRHVKTLMANAGPVFLTYRDNADVHTHIAAAQEQPPLYDITDELGVRHMLWTIPDAEALSSVFGSVPEAYVADGHHRSASAVRVGHEMAQANPSHDGSEPYNWYLCVLFPDDQLQVLAYNRLVNDLNGLSDDQFLAQVGNAFDIEPGPAMPSSAGVVSMYFQKAWHSLTPKNVDTSNPVDSLDVSILQEQLLSPILGIDDPKTNNRISFKGGHGSTNFIEKQVDSGTCGVGFSLFPTGIGQMMDVADAGEIMPPKSTWFEPKLRSGLLVNILDS